MLKTTGLLEKSTSKKLEIDDGKVVEFDISGNDGKKPQYKK